MLVDGNWVKMMESNGRSKSRTLIKLVGPLFKGDMGEYQGNFQPVRHQTLKQQTVLKFMYYRKFRIHYETKD
jgi:ABC-type siderophore export system fused ATPase/permease subunit